MTVTSPFSEMSNLRCVTCCKLYLDCVAYYLLVCAHVRSCNNGELCVFFYLRIAEFVQLAFILRVYLRCAPVSLWLDMRVTFSVEPCTSIRYILTPRMQRTHTTLGSFFNIMATFDAVNRTI